MGSPHPSQRRKSPLPWATLVLASLFAVATLQAEGASAPLVEEAHQALFDASGYFDEHPYLEPGPVLTRWRSAESLERLRLAHERDRKARGEPEALPGIQRRRQQELDEMERKAGEALAGLPARRLGVNPGIWRPVTLLTYVFMHSSVWHLLGNVLLLLLLGVYLEPALGPVRTVLLFLCATLGAGLSYAFSLPSVDHVLIGGSGLLAGLLAVFAWSLRESRREGFYALGLVGGTLWLVMPAWLGVPWALSHPGVELLGARPAADLVYWSYAGGVVGAMAAYLLLGVVGGRREGAALTHGARTSTGSASLDEALAARAAGREEAAFQQLTVLLHREPEQLDAALLLSDVARSLGRHDKADEAMLRAVRIEAKRGETTAAVRHWLDLTQKEIPRSADPALLIRIASLLRHHDHPRTAALALREALSRASGSNTAPVAARVARSAQELDPKVAHDAAWRALGTTDLSLEERQNLEDLLAVVIPKLPGGEVNLSRAWERNAGAPETIEVGETRTRVLDAVHAVPAELDAEGVHITTRGGNKKRVLFERIEAVSVAAVQGLADKPVLVVDLVLNWMDPREDRLRVIRMRGDRFDPRRVVPGDTPLDAFRRLVATLLERADAVPLPDLDGALGRPFASFDELALYERTVLMAESPLSENDA